METSDEKIMAALDLLLYADTVYFRKYLGQGPSTGQSMHSRQM